MRADVPTPAERLRMACSRARWTGAAKRCQWCDKPLTGTDMKRRRTWCSDRCFEAFQRHHVWSHAKPAALVAAKFRCSVAGCGAGRDTLVVVHRSGLATEDRGMSCAHHAEHLLVLCKAHERAWRKAGALSVR